MAPAAGPNGLPGSDLFTMMPKRSVVVFSSLGRALEREFLQSSAGTTRAVLELLAREDIPLVLCSSQTRAELELVNQAVGFTHPVIAESGGALFIPARYFGVDVPEARLVAGYQIVQFGKPYAEVVSGLQHAADWLHIDVLGFHDMSVEDVAAECGMTLLEARLAKLREYTELFRIRDAQENSSERLLRAFRALSLHCTSHGDYQQVAFHADAGEAVDVLCMLYREAMPSVLTVGVGGSLADVSLLRRMDIPLIVDQDDPNLGWPLHAKVPRARITSGAGVAGWADAIITTIEAIRREGALSPFRQSGASRSGS
jgi:mannosyl-3-phosphoglycerate phosphatase family protein